MKQSSKLNRVDFALYYFKKLQDSLYHNREEKKIWNYSATLNSLLECCIRNERLQNAVELFDSYLNEYSMMAY